MTRSIALSGKVGSGRYALVDEAVYRELCDIRWYLYRDNYAICDGNLAPEPTFRLMHRWIVGAKPGDIVDHINGDGLDNRRANLRITDSTGNVRNRRKQEKISGVVTSSRYKGVTWSDRHSLWMATIEDGGRRYSLGYFRDEDEAGRAYDAAALTLHGEYASYNFSREEAEQRIAEGFDPLPQRKVGTQTGSWKKRKVDSGYRHVYWSKASGKWVVSIWMNKRQVYFGAYETAEEANEVAIRARQQSGIQET